MGKYDILEFKKGKYEIIPRKLSLLLIRNVVLELYSVVIDPSMPLVLFKWVDSLLIHNIVVFKLDLVCS